jgi:protocatechuate 3,4-dioxygenase beta subunit
MANSRSRSACPVPVPVPALSADRPLPSRRAVFQVLGGIGAIALLAKCGGDAEGVAAGAGAGGSDTGAGGTSGTGGTSAGAGGSGTAAGAGDWATGGTAVLVGKDYGNPFEAGIGETCTVYASSTGGPCHATSDKLVRRDISEGYPGLPMRLELLIVDPSCTPIPGAIVEIWYCDTHGRYSGDVDGDMDDFCTTGDPVAAAALWYRGIQTADESGRVTFDGNFPGWYGGRATHIHFKISSGGKAYVTSQLFFDEALKPPIYDTQPEYEPTSGQGYRPNASDQVIGGANLTLSEVTVQTARQSDGAMLAWKAITVSG